MQVAKIHYNDKSAPAGFTKSLHDTGFGVITDHPIPIELVDSVYSEWDEFFHSQSKHDLCLPRRDCSCSKTFCPIEVQHVA